MLRIVRFLPVFVFFALATIPVALFTAKGPWPGAMEPQLRPPRLFPPVRFAPATFRSVNEWFSDRIGLRWSMLSLGVEITNRVWQPRIRLSAILGRDPWLFWSDDETRPTALMADARGRLRLSDEAAAVVDASLREADARYAACGKRAFLFVAPNKQTIYPDEVGMGWTGSRPSRLDGLLDKLSLRARALLIDPRAGMRAAKANHSFPMYYRTDTHWNAIGAFYAYQLIVERLAQANAIYSPERAAWENYDVTLGTLAGGDIVRNFLYLPWHAGDILPTVTPKPPLRSAVETWGPDRTTFANPDGRGHLLLHGDSFAHSLAVLLARHFATVTLVMHDAMSPPAFDGALTQGLNADVTLIEIVERNLPLLATPPRSLDRACGG